MFSNLVKICASMAIVSSALVAAAPNPSALEKRAAPGCTDSSFTAAALKEFNAHRNAHGAPDFEYDETLAKYAQGVSDTCVMEHSGGPYGENLYMVMPGVTGSFEDATKDAIYSWAKEIWDYDFDAPGFSEKTGHASALLWKSSKKAGCAWTVCSDSAMFTCNFDDSVPNMEGEYEANVLPYGTSQ